MKTNFTKFLTIIALAATVVSCGKSFEENATFGKIPYIAHECREEVSKVKQEVDRKLTNFEEERPTSDSEKRRLFEKYNKVEEDGKNEVEKLRADYAELANKEGANIVGRSVDFDVQNQHPYFEVESVTIEEVVGTDIKLKFKVKTKQDFKVEMKIARDYVYFIMVNSQNQWILKDRIDLRTKKYDWGDIIKAGQYLGEDGINFNVNTSYYDMRDFSKIIIVNEGTYSKMKR